MKLNLVKNKVHTALTSITKGLDGSGCLRMRAVVKTVLNQAKALSAAGFKARNLGLFLRRVVRW